MKILVSWSTGKDAAWMLHALRGEYPGRVAGLLTTTNEAFDRVAMHAVRRELAEAQAHAAGSAAPHRPAALAVPNDEYERRMDAAVRGFVRDGFTHVAFGDLFLEDVRRYREDRLAGSGLTPLFPLWKTKPTGDLAWDMIEGGLEARLTCVDPRKLDRAFAGRAFDAGLLADLPSSVDPCGENGEFHSLPAPARCSSTASTSALARLSNETGLCLPMSLPAEIVCLTEETTETLYLLGEGDRVVGICGYTVRPPEARQKPKVSAFISARFEKIEALKPDLILAFSDLQADIAAELIRRGYAVHAFNQRSRRRDSADDPHAGRDGRRARQGGGTGPPARAGAGRHSRIGVRLCTAAARLLRGVGRPADHRDSAGWTSSSRWREATRCSRSCAPRASRKIALSPASR